MKNLKFINCLFLILLSITAFAQEYKFPYNNPELPAEERARDIVSRMTIQEKISQIFNESPAIDRLGVPAYNWWNEALHGVARAGKATVFPQAIGLASTFDEDLIFKVSTAISDEARAKHHNFLRNDVRAIYTGLTFWTPNINIFRDPRWGRGQETYGEDPYLTSRIAVNFIKGLQGNDQKYLKTIATAKHYAVHSGPEVSRHYDNNYANDRDLYETYLPAFKAAVKEANVQSIMCAYNRFRDKPCCGSNLLLDNILRQQFGFKGYVVTDCGATTDLFVPTGHHLVQKPAQALGMVLSAGTDLNCQEAKDFVNANLDSAIQIGMINEKDINRSLIRLFKARFMLGMFDPEGMVPYSKIPMSTVGSDEHLKLTQKVAEKSLVVLKNNGILPLTANKKIALIGPNADNPSILISNYYGVPINPITPLTGLQQKLGKHNLLYAVGSPIVPIVYTNYKVISAANFSHAENGETLTGLKGEYYANAKWEGTPKSVRIDSTIDFHWFKTPLNNKIEEAFSVRWTGFLTPEKTGSYMISTSVRYGAYGEFVLKLNDKVVGKYESLSLEKGKQYKLQLDYCMENFWWGNTIEPTAALTWVETSRDYKKEALEIAKKSDVIVFCGGISANVEDEDGLKIEIDGFKDGDRTSIDLPKIQEDLLKELYKTGKPIVYINFSGSAMALNWEDQNLSAIVQGFYPGEATGTALARLLYGDYSPSGRLPVTFYKSVNDLPDFTSYQMAGRTYRYFKGEALYKFGHGLSYTSFAYKNLQVPATITVGSDVKVVVEVTNTGKMDGEEIVQLYVSNKTAKVPVPIRSLKGFKSIFLKKGETQKVEFVLTPSQLSVIDEAYNRVVQPGIFQISIGSEQPDAKLLASKSVLQAELTLTGDILEIKE